MVITRSRACVRTGRCLRVYISRTTLRSLPANLIEAKAHKNISARASSGRLNSLKDVPNAQKVQCPIGAFLDVFTNGENLNLHTLRCS